MNKKRSLTAVAVGAVAALTLTACGQQASTQEGAITAVFSNIAESPTLDPAVAYSSDGFLFVRNVYDTLTQYEPGGAEIKPSLAETWEVSDDATEYTFTLRDDVTFHDGTSLDAEDVVQSVLRVQGVNQGPASLVVGVESVEAIDDRSVRFSLSAPDVYLPGKLQKIAILSSEAITQNGTADDEWATAWFADNEAGSGPYQLSEWNKGSAIELTAFEDYHLDWDSAAPTAVTLRVDPDVQTAVQLMGQGEIDMLGAIGPDDSASAALIDGIKLVEQESLSVQILPLNVQSERLADPRVREAVTLAFDYQAMVDYYQGFADVSRGPLPSGFGGGIEELAEFERDVERAKQLLSEAGVAPGELTLSYLGLSGLSYQEFAGILLEQNLGEIGVGLDIQMVPWPQMSEIQSNPDTASDISFLNMSAVTDDPSAMLAQGYITSNWASNGGYNWAYFSDPAVDSAVAKLSGIADESARQAALLEAVQSIKESHVAIYASQPKLAQPVRAEWDVKFEIMDFNYVIRFFHARSS
jgi:peptide/nickel transport system substrate-binding protein